MYTNTERITLQYITPCTQQATQHKKVPIISFPQKSKPHQIIKGGWLLPLHVAIQYCMLPCSAHVGEQVAEARCVNVIDVDPPNHH